MAFSTDSTVSLISCASTVSRVHPPIRDDAGALRLAEVMQLATWQEIVTLGVPYEHLLASGIRDADLRDGSLGVFPTEESVNEALRSLINIAQKTIGLSKHSTGRAKKLHAC